jgi:very-short-patch-repair endonuclease
MLIDYSEHLTDRVKQFCIVSGIDVIKRRLTEKEADMIWLFIRAENKRIKYSTRKQNSMRRLPKLLQSLHALMTNQDVKTESPLEDLLFCILDDHGIANLFKAQYEIGKYRVDFANIEKKVILECDSRQYHYDERGVFIQDQKRDTYLARKGWRIIHIDGLMITRKSDEVVKKIKEELGYVYLIEQLSKEGRVEALLQEGA